ncbi:hypothetical protein NDU88_002623 [Pleurodeles waltl]|uniref:Uncharacterized protein n=1 Tax=Pleurodeles waltl TaxID=8319 RepID=A0AAV7MXZ3_PLEWA|nr:hypothetical protein NDU88_002623 [Pleurodeles waltl]
MDCYTKVVTLLPPVAGPLETPNNAAILSAIQSSREALEGQVGEVRIEVSLLHQGLRNMAERVTSVEARISDLEDRVQNLSRD